MWIIFSILRSDNFKDGLLISHRPRYRASVQLAGPIYAMQDYFDRFEYFIELRPEYESIYDISHRFGNGRNGKVSGRSGKPSQNNVDLLKAFGLAPPQLWRILAEGNRVLIVPPITLSSFTL